MTQKYYLTAAIPYVNARPHIGHALEFVQADTIARFRRLLGDQVLTLSGGDENALKNVQAAEAAGQPIQDFVDQNTQSFLALSQKLNAAFDIWQKGSDQVHHYPASQKLWQLCDQNGDIYQKSYSGLYCVGCEAFYQPEELEDNQCPEHPGKSLETVTETNYFFRLSRYQDQLLHLIDSDQLLIIPQTRKNEVIAFIKRGLADISISRTNQRARDWGIPVPGDPSQRIYVWFDALNIYQSGVGFGWDQAKYHQWWPADVHVIGKGILRFHAVYWPAFLLSAGLALPKSLFVHEYLTVSGQKMSKTLGNVFDPLPLLDRYGADPLRYFLLAKVSPFADSDFSKDKFLAAYHSDLANGLGNTASRLASLCAKSGLEFPSDTPPGLRSQVKNHLHDYRFDLALASIWLRLKEIDQLIEEKRPWQQQGSQLQSTLQTLVAHFRQVSFELQPFLPQTSATLTSHFQGPEISALKPLFPRLDQ